MQTIHLEHNQITGSKYILKDFNGPCTTVKYASHKSKTKPSNKVSTNVVHKKRPVKKSHKIEITPILYLDVLHIEYALESQEMFSNKTILTNTQCPRKQTGYYGRSDTSRL